MLSADPSVVRLMTPPLTRGRRSVWLDVLIKVSVATLMVVVAGGVTVPGTSALRRNRATQSDALSEGGRPTGAAAPPAIKATEPVCSAPPVRGLNQRTL